MNTNIRIVLCALLGFFLTSLVFDSGVGLLVLGFITTVIGTVIFFVTKPKARKRRRKSESSEIIKEIDDTTVLLLYILSFFIPLAGFIVGAIYASKEEEHYKHVGKNCLIFSVMNIIIGFITIAVMLGSM